ncbi:hypothetical protein PHISCL_04902 [Aspergillus sclerotialis]|uniref:Paramyosin n=1 Tax=Aspergillus sclerotialis TaxID=2070753 RepID=A0A3A2ZMY8_9EURO|nr:hypothetical protein PHISCL_04902 [Aspergillus sclerotialis]
MSDQMDIDRPAPRPRDPRLSNQENRSQPPSPPVRTGSADSRRKSSVASPAVQNSSPIETGNQAQKHGDKFIKDISDLIRSNVAAAKETSEREKAQKKQRTSDGLSLKAAPHVGFPAASSFFQETSKVAGADIKRLDEAIKKHESHCRQLEKSLIANLSSNFSRSPSNFEERLKKLESDYEAKFTKLRRDYEEKLSKYRNDSEGRIIKLEYQVEQVKATAPEKKLENVQNRLGQLEGSFRQNAAQQKQARGGVEDNISPISGRDKIAPQGQDLNGLRKDMILMKRDIEELDYDLRPLLPLKDHCMSLLEDMDKAILHQNERLDAIQASRGGPDNLDNRTTALGPTKGSSENVSNDYKAMLKDVISRVENMEAHIAKYPQPSANLDGILHNLSEQITHLQSLQDMRDDIEGSEINEVKKSLAQQTEALNLLKIDHGRVSDQLSNVVNNITTSLSHGVAGLRQTFDSAQRHIETLTVSVHSLETRYNNLNTEPMVKNMLAAMQELYPSAAQLTDEVRRLRLIFDREWPSLKTAVDQLFQAHNGYVGDISRLRQDLDKLSESLKSHHDSSKSSLLNSDKVTARLNALDEKADAVRQWMDGNRKQPEEKMESKETADADIMQKFDALKNHIDSLAQWINNHGKSLEQKLESTETSEAIQELNEKHNFLICEAEKIAGQVSSFVSFFDQNKQIPQELNNLLNRVSDVEESISKIQSNNNASTETGKSHREEVSSLQKRIGELEASSGTGISYAADISALQRRFEGLEQTTSADDRALWTEFGKLRDLVENPKSSGRKDKESNSQQKENSPLVETPSNSKRPKTKDSHIESTKPNFMDMAEINPAQALREKKKNKKKRPHSPSVQDSSSVQFPSSPGGLSSVEGSSVADPAENKGEKVKKKKKRKTQEKAVSVE